jgi:hypothetical protein
VGIPGLGFGGETAAAPDAYAANGFSPAFVVDETVDSAPYYRSGGSTVGYSDIYTTDTTAGGLSVQNNSSGNLVWGPHNLLTYSEQFDNAAWTKSNVSVISNQAVAPDGTTTMDQVVQDSSNAQHSVFNSSLAFAAGGKYRGYAVVAYEDWQYLFFKFNGLNFPGNPFITFDVLNGTITEQSSDLDDASVTDLGDGRYLIMIEDTADSAAGTGLYVGFSDGATGGWNPSFTGDGSSSFYVWGAHAHRSDLGGMADVPADVRSTSALDKYVPTTAAAKYLIRRRHYPYNGTSYVPTLLHEPVGATNLVPTMDFSDSAWTKDGATIDSAAGVGPDGTSGSAYRLNVTAGAGDHQVFDSFSGYTAGDTITNSVYVKNDGGRYISLTIYWSDNIYVSQVFDLTNGAKGDSSTGSSSGTLVGSGAIDEGDGWYRLWVAGSSGAGTGKVYLSVEGSDSLTPTIESSSGAPTYTAVDGDDYLIFGPQTEVGSVPSSYIPTTGASVTRSADTCKVKAAALPDATASLSHAFTGRGAVNGAPANLRIFSRTNTGAERYESVLVSSLNVRQVVTEGSVNSTVDTSGTVVPGPSSAINTAGRFAEGASEQVALSGAAGTEETPAAGTGAPSINSSDLVFGEYGVSAGFEVNLEVDTLRLWSDDIAEAGIEEATA